MSWTTVDIIKIHLQALTVGSFKVRFLPLVLETEDQFQLPHSCLDRSSVKVFIKGYTEPKGSSYVTLPESGWITLGVEAVVPGEVTVSSDSWGVSRFRENKDFAVNYSSGKICRLSGGTIGVSDSVYIWSLPLDLCTIEVDYDLNEESGLIKRIPTGILPEYANLFICYSTTSISASEALIMRTIEEAEAKISDRLKDEYSTSSSDFGLISGATELAISMICDDLALRTLTSINDSSADNRARRLMELSIRFETRAANTLSPFLRLPIPASAQTRTNSSRSSGW
jgi:hypothetical protein